MSWIYLLVSLASADPARFAGELRVSFPTSAKFEGFAPYTVGQSHAFGVDAYPPQLSDRVAPFLRDEVKRELSDRLRQYKQDPRDFALFNIFFEVTSSYAPKKAHDGHVGEIHFRVYARAQYFASKPIKFRSRQAILGHGVSQLKEIFHVRPDRSHEVFALEDFDVTSAGPFATLKLSPHLTPRLPLQINLGTGGTFALAGIIYPADVACSSLMKR